METKKTKKNITKKVSTKAVFSHEADIYSAQGKKTSSIKLPENVFGVAWSDALIHQVVTAMQANARPTVAHAKMRGEVRGGGKKPWAQKGTGRARHGSSRSPIWKGGGVTHGPRSDRDYSQVIPKKMRAKALFIALSRKLKDGELIFVDSFGISEPKTATAQKALAMLSKVSGFGKLVTKRKNAALIAFSDPTEATQKSFRNIGNVTAVAVRNLNPVAVLGSTYLIIENPEAAVAIVASRLSAQSGIAKKTTKAQK
ncbi:50S ribosomal protein L4 [Candidatus Kaiserbacteria bacterium RIFCSPHIGHO2_02_FULL_55_20]|uniref:Large ribosomal subunit protein uL4 n=1 Tax=Candidatus Kaiserbacteria bacterium RIFCSPHIGHO2_02_FULL_55_20 TaxID=1798497 RepID=A0A1F6DYF7_9BACT|nr:MAG: 50S ribosomal protein L4 [Candidatus Kaiserbacteria bacterium RIFCSPHIGHO2_01_FULL_55_37]OGG66032.1 MAG: 50S ribosomal protein L4 [Candidatus Kaiserbacteria bacterium RIFCSPHIGHO2_02_FULL_55_20]